MKSFNTEFVIFDVETTGLSPLNGDRIIEIAAVKVKNEKIVDEFTSLINPQRNIPIEAQRVHNITADMIADAPLSEDVLPKIISFIGGACLVGHNVKFDLNFLCYELSLVGWKLKNETPAVDTLKMSRYLMAHLRSHRLSYLASSLGVIVEETHRALSDVKLTMAVFYRLLDMACDQGYDQVQDLLKQFSVQKPNFRIEEVNHELLF